MLIRLKVCVTSLGNGSPTCSRPVATAACATGVRSSSTHLSAIPATAVRMKPLGKDVGRGQDDSGADARQERSSEVTKACCLDIDGRKAAKFLDMSKEDVRRRWDAEHDRRK